MNYLRRHRPRRDQWASPHQRARVLSAERLDEQLSEADEAWLGRHLEECLACAAIAADYAAERGALRALRDAAVPPPRDLWARTSAAIEREADRPGTAGSRRDGARRAGLPLGVLSGALVVAVVVGASMFSRSTPVVPPPTATPAGSPRPTPAPAATPLVIAGGDVAWIRQGGDGRYGLFVARIAEVCPGRDRDGCAPITETEARDITHLAGPRTVVLSPTTDQLVLVDDDGDGDGGTVYVVPVVEPTAGPTGTPEPSPPPTPTAIATPSETPTSTPSTEPTPSDDPTPDPSVDPTPRPTPDGATAIADGIVLVGDAAGYSADGQWFAFSAVPVDGSHGPDIYVWHVGDAEARPVTSDHRSVFAQWLDDQVLGSRVIESAETSGSPSPSAASSSPSARSPVPPSASASIGPSASPPASASAEPPPELTARAFLLDPASGTETPLGDVALWRPAVDPSEAWAVYWDGTLAADGSRAAWRPAAGRLVLGPWSVAVDDGGEPSGGAEASAVPSGTARPSSGSSTKPARGPSAAPSADPRGKASPPAEDGPSDLQVIAEAPLADWDARWDSTGTRLAVWIADNADPSVGRLTLYVVDPATGRLDGHAPLLRDQPALAGFSLGNGLLAWATPPGQDGEGSRIQVLAWSGSNVGSAETQPGSEPIVIVR